MAGQFKDTVSILGQEIGDIVGKELKNIAIAAKELTAAALNWKTWATKTPNVTVKPASAGLEFSYTGKGKKASPGNPDKPGKADKPDKKEGGRYFTETKSIIKGEIGDIVGREIRNIATISKETLKASWAGARYLHQKFKVKEQGTSPQFSPMDMGKSVVGKVGEFGQHVGELATAHALTSHHILKAIGIPQLATMIVQNPGVALGVTGLVSTMAGLAYKDYQDMQKDPELAERNQKWGSAEAAITSMGQEVTKKDEESTSKIIKAGKDDTKEITDTIELAAPKETFWGQLLSGLTSILGGGPRGGGLEGTLPSSGEPSYAPWASGVIRKPEYEPFIEQAIKATGRTDITKEDIARMIQAESSWNPNALGKATDTGERAKGLMQLMPGTAGNIDVYDPEQNIKRGVEYYAQMLNRYSGDKEKALAAYNMGPRKLDRALGGLTAPMDRDLLRSTETRNYLRDVYGGPPVAPKISGAPTKVLFDSLNYAAKNFTYEMGGGHGVDPNISKSIDCSGLVSYGYKSMMESMASQLQPDQLSKIRELTTGSSEELLRKNIKTMVPPGGFGAGDIKPGDVLARGGAPGHSAIAYQDVNTGLTKIAETSKNPDIPGMTVRTGISPEEYLSKKPGMSKISPWAEAKIGTVVSPPTSPPAEIMTKTLPPTSLNTYNRLTGETALQKSIRLTSQSNPITEALLDSNKQSYISNRNTMTLEQEKLKKLYDIDKGIMAPTPSSTNIINAPTSNTTTGGGGKPSNDFPPVAFMDDPLTQLAVGMLMMMRG